MNQTRSFLLIAWLLLAYLLWQAWDAPAPTPAVEAAGQPTSTTIDDAAVPQIPSVPSEPIMQSDAATPVPSATIDAARSQRLVLSNDVLRLQIDTRGGSIVGAPLLDYGQSAAKDSSRVPLLASDSDHFFVAQIGIVSASASAPSHETVFTNAAATSEQRS